MFYKRVGKFHVYRHGGDGRFRKEPLGFFELSVPLVRSRVRELARVVQVAIPAPDDVTIQLSVLQIATFKCVNLAL